MSARTEANYINEHSINQRLATDFKEPWKDKTAKYSCTTGTFTVTVKSSDHRTDVVMGLFLLAAIRHPADTPCQLSNSQCQKQHAKFVTTPKPVERKFCTAKMAVEFSDGCASSAIANKVKEFAKEFNQRCSAGVAKMQAATNLVAIIELDGSVHTMDSNLHLKLSSVID